MSQSHPCSSLVSLLWFFSLLSAYIHCGSSEDTVALPTLCMDGGVGVSSHPQSSPCPGETKHSSSLWCHCFDLESLEGCRSPVVSPGGQHFSLSPTASSGVSWRLSPIGPVCSPKQVGQTLAMRKGSCGVHAAMGWGGQCCSSLQDSWGHTIPLTFVSQ